MIVRWRCDEQMAEKKGILGQCNYKCSQCLCCIVTDALGIESHVGVVHGGDPNIIARNLSLCSPRKTSGKETKS